jgi:hypothetical protein
MSKQTSAALNFNDLFSDDHVHPEHGDKASQSQVTMKSDSASAGAARPSRLAAVNTADGPADLTTPPTIHVKFDLDSKNCSYLPGDTVTRGGTVYLQSTALVSVTTTPTNAFTSGPYSAPTANQKYTLTDGITGPITLTQTGTSKTGTINVVSDTAKPTTIYVSATSGGFSYIPGSTVQKNGTVYLRSSTGSLISVTTAPKNAFTSGPYAASTADQEYTLTDGFTGSITLDAGTTGTINVGGDTRCPPPDEGNDDGDHRDRKPPPRA